MKSFECKIQSFQGLHAQSAMRLAGEAQKYSSVIIVVCGEKRANVKNIMELMGLRAGCGALLVVTIEGEDEALAAESLEALCHSFL